MQKELVKKKKKREERKDAEKHLPTMAEGHATAKKRSKVGETQICNAYQSFI